uniref:tetratricopeptide repeat protein n=1 Tax=Neisseria oralis TaxID=1107316 RepID=UPI003557CAD6
MNVQSLINEGVELFKNKKFDKAIEKLNQALDEIKDSHIQVQNNIHFWLGRCYLEQAMKAQGKESEQLFGRAVEHHQQQLRLAERLADKQNSLQRQSNAQYWLGRCYLEQAMKAK